MGLLFPRQPEAESVTIKTSREIFFLASLFLFLSTTTLAGFAPQQLKSWTLKGIQ
jgi:hypothetical protein